MANGADVVGAGPQEPDESGGSAPPPDASGGPPGAGGGGALPFLQKGPQPSAPGPGDQASSMTQIANAIAMIQAALAGLGAGTPIHRDALRAIQSLSRHMAQGNPTAGTQQTQVQDLLRNLMRNALLSRIMQQRGTQGGQGNTPGAMSPAPMPSTPLPGA